MSRVLAYLIVSLAVIAACYGLAYATVCAGMPRWLGINASGAMEYCGTDGQIHTLAFGDTAGIAPTPIITFPTPLPTAWPTSGPTAAPTAWPTAAPTPAATVLPTRVPALTAVYDPASLAANTTRTDTVTVTGIVTGRAVVANPGAAPATGCVISAVWASAANTVSIQWRNTFAATTACDSASSTWTFTQP